MSATANVVENLFRKESGRLVAALTRILGPHNVELAEDVVSDVLCQALEVWKFDRLPDNPSAWLVRAARNRAVDLIRREAVRRRFAPDIAHVLGSEWTLAPTVEALLSQHEIADDQLRMMFSCCAETLPAQAQAALVLKLLCGFGVGEIAAAFLSTPDAIEKQLTRGRRALARSRNLFPVSGSARIRRRLDGVQRALYLLFNEGYHGSHAESSVRADLCAEAIRLATLLCEHPATATPRSQALLGLMCLHAARLPGRVDGGGQLVLLEDQDRARWDHDLIARGLAWLERSSAGDELSEYHVEAAIAAQHAGAPNVAATNWPVIVSLYDVLLRLRPGPVVALSRAIAVGQAGGPDAGLAALAAIEGAERLAHSPFLLAARAEMLQRAGRSAEARDDLAAAVERARNPSEAALLRRKLARLACLA